MSVRNGRPVPIAGVIAGCFLLGAGVFGLFRGLNAEPLPDLPPVGSVTADPLPLPAMPTLPPGRTPAVEPAAGVSPSIPTLPKLPPLDGVPAPTLPSPAPAKPLDAVPLPSPKLEPLPPMTDSTNPLPVPTAVPSPTLPAPAAVKPLDAVPLPTPSLNSLPPAAPISTPTPGPVKPLDAVSLPGPSLDPIPTPTAVAPAPASPTLPKLPDPALASPVLPKLPDPIPPTTVNPVSTPPATLNPLPTDPVPPVKPDLNLRPEQPGLNVNFKTGGPAPAELPLPKEVAPEALPAPRKFGDELIPAPRPLTEPATIQTTLTPPSSAPGDAPMPILSKQMLLSTALGVALAAAPVATRPAVAADDPKPMTPEQKMTAMQTAIDDLVKDMKLMKEKKEKLELELYGRTDGKTALTPSEMGVLKRLEKSEADLRKAEGELKKTNELVKELETKLATQTTTAAKTPLSGVLAGKGKVVLVNEFKSKLSIMVNGKSYPLDVNETKDVLVNEGEFTYELVEFPNASPIKSTIKEAETVTLRIK